jgi:hypothetical protein
LITPFLSSNSSSRRNHGKLMSDRYRVNLVTYIETWSRKSLPA